MSKTFSNTGRDGFTLVELSIVIVIIGLLVGTVLSGQRLIRNARIASAISEVGKYDQAVQTFLSKFDTFPGDVTPEDMNRLGLDSNYGDPTDLTSNFVCNQTGINTGNGDFRLSNESVGMRCENRNFWLHLSNSELIESNYTGTVNDGANIGFPALKLGGELVGVGVYNHNTLGDGGGTPGLMGANYNYYVIGILNAGTNAAPYSNSIPPDVAFQLDQKLDDGFARLPFGSEGRVTARRGTTGNLYARTGNNRCALNPIGTEVENRYNVDLTDPNEFCILSIRMQ